MICISNQEHHKHHLSSYLQWRE